MKIIKIPLEQCAEAAGVVVVIDVLRAFSTAAYALAAGASRIILVSSIEEALQKRRINPDVLLMGEMDGKPIPGFDLGNSPQPFKDHDLHGCTLVQRTSAGTQGVVRARGAEKLLTCSFVNARATAAWLKKAFPPIVTFIATGSHSQDGGDEDLACADYIEALLEDEKTPAEPYLRRVSGSATGRKFGDPLFSYLPAADLPYCLAVNRFDFVMQVTHEDGDLVLKL
jgi:2-phosphosulfolactate phosphatase